MARFDFGVPLEDVFPPNDIHPRLKFLFEEAYRLYLNSEWQIEKIVRQLQGSLETRLNLKERIVHEVHYDISIGDIGESPGAYFWVIRHFLGLLPIPLLPDYASEIKFDWICLSDKCRRFLQYYQSQRKKKYQLDYNIAESINLLPFSHFLLLCILITFMRKLSYQKPIHEGRLNRRALLYLAKYFCQAICIRPYTPGHNVKDEKMVPLFFYLLLRWREIEKKCKVMGHPAYFLESNCLNYEKYNGICIRDNWAQTLTFSPEIITVYKNVPYFCDNNNYLKDISCQTERIATAEKEVQNVQMTNLPNSDEFVEEKCEVTLEEYPAVVADDEGCLSENEKASNNPEFSFPSTDDSSNQAEWRDVIKEMTQTVKKVEDYIYDDYETFSKEEYNQISSKSKSTIFDKISKIGWSYTPPKNTASETEEIPTDQEYSQHSYFKFDDVDNMNKSDDKKALDDNTVQEYLNITFQRSSDSQLALCTNTFKENGNTENNEKSRRTFSLKRFKIKLDFFRVLAPKKTNSIASYDSVESKVKYKKIKAVKSSTL